LTRIDTTLLPQVIWLLILALPVASISWTITHEEIFRELREYCTDRSRSCRRLWQRKLFYALTCEYCFSHYVIAGVLTFTGYRLLLPDWRGVVIAFFALAAVAAVYLSLYGRLRVDIKSERVDVEVKERQLGRTAKEPLRPLEIDDDRSHRAGRR
jgi:hypothetical protein